MLKKLTKIHIGLRTIKTAAAVVIAMIVVDFAGATTSKLIFAMLGAMAAVMPTFKESLESCISQVIGVLFGAACGVLLMMLPLDGLVACGIGIVLVITLYNTLHIRFSPTLPCMIVVMICMTPDIQPISYALTRIWDTAIGLGVGIAINSLVFPYDNSNQIRTTVESLDSEVIRFLEDLFDGDDELPDAQEMTGIINAMARQLNTFSNQKLLMRLRRQQEEIETFRICEAKGRELLARMEVLSHMGRPGRLDENNRKDLAACGAVIRDSRPLNSVMERDVVTNFHVRQILYIRRELIEALRNIHSK